MKVARAVLASVYADLLDAASMGERGIRISSDEDGNRLVLKHSQVFGLKAVASRTGDGIVVFWDDSDARRRERIGLGSKLNAIRNKAQPRASS